MSVADLWNVIAVVAGAWLVASCVAMVALLAIHDAERRRLARAALDELPRGAEARDGSPAADRLASSPGAAANSAAGRL